MKKYSINRCKKSQGVGLIEVLVSVLVLGVGALGIATMQLTGLKYNKGSQGRTQAIFLANDMLDRLRANVDFASSSPAYNTNGANTVNNTTPNPPFNCYTATCTPAQMAEFDKWHWLEQVENALPFGSGQIASRDVDGERVYDITLQWRQSAVRQGDAGTAQDFNDEVSSFTFRSRL